MHLQLRYIFFIFCLVLAITSCRSSKHSRGPKEYIEKNGLNDSRKPHEIAKEYGNNSKGVKRKYRKDMAKRWKKMHPGEKKSQNPYR